MTQPAPVVALQNIGKVFEPRGQPHTIALQSIDLDIQPGTFVSLIWPSPNGIGLMDPKAFGQTVQIAQQYQIIKNKPDMDTYRTDLTQKALDSLNNQGLDTRGRDFKKRTVQVTKGGE